MADASAWNGGSPIRQKPWPTWPVATAEAEQLLVAAFHSGRWTVSGAYTGRPSLEQQFTKAFADYLGVRRCVATCHGSSALTVALEVLGVGPGSEVIVPGLTWVACASAVTGVGATPILVDVDPETLCIDSEAVEGAITERTAAIMLVHLFCSLADLDRFLALSERTGIPLIEDCSQAHGATWRGRKVGSLGTIGVFSFQQTKLLTSGEGGAVVCNDDSFADRAEQLRADGRRFIAQPRIGHLDLEEVGAVQGRNYCLTEFQAALLIEGLGRLDAENGIRRENVAYLASRLDEVGGIRLQGAAPGLNERTFYHLCLRLDMAQWGSWNIDQIAEAVGTELQLGAVEAIDTPLNRNILYNPLLSPRTAAHERDHLDPRRFALPAAEAARASAFTLPHRALLGDRSDMDDILAVLAKIRRHALSQAACGRL